MQGNWSGIHQNWVHTCVVRESEGDKNNNIVVSNKMEKVLCFHGLQAAPVHGAADVNIITYYTLCFIFHGLWEHVFGSKQANKNERNRISQQINNIIK